MKDGNFGAPPTGLPVSSVEQNQESWVSVENYGLHHVPLDALEDEVRPIIIRKVHEFKSYKIFGIKKTVTLSKIRWTLQGKVDPERVKLYAQEQRLIGTGTPLVVFRKEITLIEHEGFFLLLDGNHRVSAMRLRGDEETTPLTVIAV